jgi:hypothetical protein
VAKFSRLKNPLKGTAHIAPDTDLTLPADPYWALDLDSFTESLKDQTPPRGCRSAAAGFVVGSQGRLAARA